MSESKNYVELSDQPPKQIRQLIEQGDLSKLKSLTSRQVDIDYHNICNLAALYGQLKILKWAYLRVYELTRIACAYAASNGHLKVLKWLRKNKIPWDMRVLSYAAKHNHFKLYKWAKRHKCPPVDYVYSNDVEHSSIDDLSKPTNLTSCISKHAALHGHLEILNLQHKKRWPIRAIRSIIKGEQVNLLKYAIKHDRLPNIGECTGSELNIQAILVGNPHVLKLLYKNNYISSHFSHLYAAKLNKLEIFKSLTENCEMRGKNGICYNAAVNGNLEMLKIARVHGCSWVWSKQIPGGYICKTYPNYADVTPEIREYCKSHNLELYG